MTDPVFHPSPDQLHKTSFLMLIIKITFRFQNRVLVFPTLKSRNLYTRTSTIFVRYAHLTVMISMSRERGLLWLRYEPLQSLALRFGTNSFLLLDPLY